MVNSKPLGNFYSESHCRQTATSQFNTKWLHRRKPLAMRNLTSRELDIRWIKVLLLNSLPYSLHSQHNVGISDISNGLVPSRQIYSILYCCLLPYAFSVESYFYILSCHVVWNAVFNILPLWGFLFQLAFSIKFSSRFFSWPILLLAVINWNHGLGYWKQFLVT